MLRQSIMCQTTVLRSDGTREQRVEGRGEAAKVQVVREGTDK